jgi:hypothetical protein
MDAIARQCRATSNAAGDPIAIPCSAQKLSRTQRSDRIPIRAGAIGSPLTACSGSTTESSEWATVGYANARHGCMPHGPGSDNLLDHGRSVRCSGIIDLLLEGPSSRRIYRLTADTRSSGRTAVQSEVPSDSADRLERIRTADPVAQTLSN